MNDNDVLDQLNESVPGAHMHTPVEQIMARGRARRRHRLSALAATGVAASVVAGLGLWGIGGSGATPGTGGSVELAAFTVASGPNGSSTLTLRKGAQYRLDPDALREALAQHGIPAVVTLDKVCDTNPEPAGLDQVVSSRRLPDGSVVTTFTPSAMPAGSKLSIGYFATHTSIGLIEADAPLVCGDTSGSRQSITK